MSRVLDSMHQNRDVPGIGPFLRWLPVLVGMVALYLPAYVTLANGAWQTEEHGHGPIVFLIVIWLVWTKRAELTGDVPEGKPLLGGALLGFGLLAFVIGRSQSIDILELLSQFPVLTGVLLFLGGWRYLRALWFPLLFFVFLIPPPGFVIDALTGPLKQYVSIIAEFILHLLGYPIARSGVVLTIGPYQLLVADACSGLHSMYSLSAVGLLYVYLMKYPGVFRSAILLASMIPIAFAANVCRVMVLVLVTYHLGDEAGQGFLHGLAGMLLFVIALVMVFALDFVLGLIFSKKAEREVSP